MNNFPECVLHTTCQVFSEIQFFYKPLLHVQMWFNEGETNWCFIVYVKCMCVFWHFRRRAQRWTLQCLLCYSHLLHFSLFRKKQQGALPWGFFCYFFGKLMECLFPLKENCLRMVPLFDHPQDNKAFPNVQFEPPLAQLCRKTADCSWVAQLLQ